MGKYKYFGALADVINTEPKQKMLDAYQSAVNDSFLVATNWFEIEEEHIDTHKFSNVKVRLNTIYSEFHSKLSDDYRKITFRDFDHPRALGTKFHFDNSVWLTINYDEYGKPTASVVIQKCRNVIKWIDPSSGAILSEPCVFDVTNDQSAKPLFNKFITVSDGYVGVAVQNNDVTKKLTMNQRFYFNGQCYKVWNIFNALNTPTFNGCPITYLILGKSAINEQLDNVELGIANYNQYNYSVSIDQGDFDGIVGKTGTLTASVLDNKESVTRDLVWSSSDSNVVLINKNTGEYVFENIGTATLTVAMKSNTLITNSIEISVVENVEDNYYISVNPAQRYILQNDSLEYSVFGYNNETKLDTTFSFSVSGTSEENYIFDAIDGNHFRVYNIKKSSNNLVVAIHDEGGTIPDSNIEIELQGVFYVKQ